MNRRLSRRLVTAAFWALLLAAVIAALVALTPGGWAAAQGGPFPEGLPSQIGAARFEGQLMVFLQRRGYAGWVHDPDIRSTGPWIDGQNFGTHPAVRVYYSPGVWAWVQGGRQGDIPDGAVIIKEQYAPPADQQPPKLEGYAIMVRDRQASWDGWYWSSGAGLGNPTAYPFNYPWAGYGQYCVNCHASTDSKMSTFSSARNVLGDPMTYLSVEPSMRPKPPADSVHSRIAPHPRPVAGAAPTPGAVGPAFQQLYPQIREVSGPRPLPPESLDSVVQGPAPHGQKGFLTSDQCIGCHDATRNLVPVQPNMVFADPSTKRDVNLSAYGEWRSSMMGLAGRDPVFYAQLESERALHPELAPQIDNLCMGCHGAMGQRQLAADTGGKGLFTHDTILATPDHDPANATYGALGREGVSCTICHRIAAEGLGTPASFTGGFKLDPPDVLNGPYADVSTLPMQNALGVTPRQGQQITRSSLCGSCHTIDLPILDAGKIYPGDGFGSFLTRGHEQDTYLEWRNSIYSNEGKSAPSTAVTCQGCHMPNTYAGNRLAFRIANTEDDTFPAVDHRAPDQALKLTVREPYARHMLAGINVFALSMFQQFPDTLGVRPTDPMAVFGTPEPGISTAINSALDLARRSAKVEVVGVRCTPSGLEARVKVTNLAGHRFPSGVSFRRAFIEFRVLDARGQTLWASGRTTDQGVILNGLSDQPLATEFFAGPANGQVYQPHHLAISSGSQVQIYEELTRDTRGLFTTSFLGRAHEVKDNRLMPRGWAATGPDAAATRPNGGEGRPVSAGYRDGSGSDEVVYRVPRVWGGATPVAVTATLYYQAIPPYYLRQRFQTAPQGEASRTLWSYAGRLDVNGAGSPVQDWKLRVSTDRKSVR